MRKIGNILIQLAKILRQRGLGYVLYFLSGVFLPRIHHQLIRRFPNFQSQIAALGGLPLQSVNLMQNRAAQFQASTTGRFTTWEEYPVSAEFRASVKTNNAAEIVLGRIDNDGRLQSDFGELPFAENVTTADFVPRRRFPLDIVLRDGFVLVRKDFRGDQKRFTQEWFNLTRLQPHVNVPAVYSVDKTKTVLYKNYVLGRTIRDIVVDSGAKILTVDTEGDQALSQLDTTERLYAVLKRGLDHFPHCFSEQFIPAIEDQLNLIHTQGVAKLSLTFGNIMVDSNEQPWFIDLESAEAFRNTDVPLFHLRRDQDRDKFNRIYGQDVLTESKSRSKLQAQRKKLGGWYAPIDFGRGLTIGGIHSIESGTGRWEYLNKQVMTPLINGKRVLDLGCNNGIMPIMMLRAGATHVTGIELMPEYIESAHLVHDIFEWRDMRTYDFTVIPGNMTDILTADWGQFDVITSLCTLYYLEPEEMADVVRRATELAPTIIIQANNSTRKEAEDNKAEKSQANYLNQLLIENGYSFTQQYGPDGYARPLIIGTKSA